MKIFNTLRYILLIAVFFLFAMVSNAQDLQTPAALELYKMNGLWMNSSNAGGIMLDDVRQYATIEAGYKWTRGDFRRPQQGGEDDRLNVGTEGGTMLGKNLYAWGHFDYERIWIENANFNMSIIDPYRGVPYYSMDIVPSPWRNQNFDMGVKLGTRKFNSGLSFGVKLDYRSSSAAKQLDIRTKNFAMKLVLQPGIVYSFGNHSIGANFNYFSIKEEAKSDMISGSELIYYTLKGLGVATYTLTSSAGRETNYTGNNVGGGFQYALSSSKLKILIDATYDYKVEDVERGWTKPYKEGTVKDEMLTFGLKAYTHGLYASYIDARFSQRNIDGIEYVLTQIPNGWKVANSNIRSQYSTTSASAAYTLVANNGKGEYKWKASAGVYYIKQDDKYILPRSIFNYENLSFDASFKKNFMFGGHRIQRILFEAGVLWNKNLSGKYDYNGVRPDSAPVKGLMAEELNYLTSDYLTGRTSINYSQKIGRKKPAVIFGLVEFRYTKAIDNRLDHRTFVKVAAGCNF